MTGVDVQNPDTSRGLRVEIFSWLPTGIQAS